MLFDFSRRVAAFAAVLGALTLFAAPCAQASGLKPVTAIADTHLTIDTPQGRAVFPLYLSKDWSTPQPQVTRAVIVVHGKLRNADTYFRTAEKAQAAAHASPAATLLIAPQFLATLDLRAPGAPADLLRWRGDAWMAGEAASAPVPLSSYAVLDAIAARLADRRRFPNLRHVVFAGHSGGGQVIQRYAVAARGVGVLTDAGIDVRYLVANPSSYAYFDAKRPDAQGVAVPFGAAQQCSGFNDWKYGMAHRPPYLDDRTPAQLEAAYAVRRVDYLVGGDDTDPHQAALDVSCAAEAQGPYRLARGEAYFRYLQTRHPAGLKQTFHVVPGVGHNGSRMLTSACALTAMFGRAGDAGRCEP